jgi:hypothetical protein
MEYRFYSVERVPLNLVSLTLPDLGLECRKTAKNASEFESGRAFLASRPQLPLTRTHYRAPGNHGMCYFLQRLLTSL